MVRGKAAGDEVRVLTAELLGEVLGIPVERQNNGHAKRLTALMRELGWEPAKFKIAGKSPRGFRRPKPEGHVDDQPPSFRGVAVARTVGTSGVQWTGYSLPGRCCTGAARVACHCRHPATRQGCCGAPPCSATGPWLGRCVCVDTGTLASSFVASILPLPRCSPTVISSSLGMESGAFGAASSRGFDTYRHAEVTRLVTVWAVLRALRAPWRLLVPVARACFPPDFFLLQATP